jgi:hypothetical protein
MAMPAAIAAATPVGSVAELPSAAAVSTVAEAVVSMAAEAAAPTVAADAGNSLPTQPQKACSSERAFVFSGSNCVAEFWNRRLNQPC